MPRKSICKKVKRIRRCTRLRGCKIAKGSKRTFCRKKHNQTKRKSLKLL